jgi:hypothetical protein
VCDVLITGELDNKVWNFVEPSNRTKQTKPLSRVLRLRKTLNLENHVDRPDECVRAANSFPVVTPTLAVVGDDEHSQTSSHCLLEWLEFSEDGTGLVLVISTEPGPFVERVDDKEPYAVLMAVGNGLRNDLGPISAKSLYTAKNVDATLVPPP